MSDNFKRALKVAGVIALLLAGAFLWLRHRIRDMAVPPRDNRPANVRERVTYNENRHTLTTTTDAGTTTVYSRNPTVDLRRDGTVKVHANSWGLEFNPILGIGYQDTRRAYLGANHFYFRQFDVFTSVGLPLDNGHVLIEPMTGVSFNFWHNCSLNVGVNPVNILLGQRPDVGGFLSVRL